MRKSSEKSGFRFMVGVSVRVRVSYRSSVSADRPIAPMPVADLGGD